MQSQRQTSFALAFAATIAAGGAALAQDSASVEMTSVDGAALGTLELTETPSGVLIRGELVGMEPGERAFHFHEVGECVPPFESAGGHFNPGDKEHGYFAEGGHHAGDMPNVRVSEDGTLFIEVLNPEVTLASGEANSLRDGDGTSLMIHYGTDDYESQPSGDAGDRIACGVVE